MTLREVIDAAGKNCVSFKYDWDVDEDGKIWPVICVDLSLDAEVEVVYYWYHHCNDNVNKQEIWNIIERHDFKAFTEWREKLKCEPYGGEPHEYLPSKATMFVAGEFVGEVGIAHSPEAFSLIMSQDYECG